MDNQKQNPVQPSRAPANEPPPIQQPEGPIVYNVMPKVKSYDGMVEPVLKFKASEQPVPESKPDSFFKKYKFYVIMAIVVLVGAPAVYFVATKVLNRPIEQENLLLRDINDINRDNDSDSVSPSAITDEWRQKYFSQCADSGLCGDEADPDHDGLTNLQEFNQTTDPNNPDSDQEGLADGDELNVFSSNPLNSHTAGNSIYSDADYVKGAYSFTDDKPLSESQINELAAKMKEKGLHPPTIVTLGDTLLKIYHFDGSTATPESATPASAANPLSKFDMSLEAKQERDAQRTNTIKNVGIALVKYFDDNKKYPSTSDFKAMFDSVKVYLKVAANPIDPINIDPYVYSYALNSKGDDFTLSFYSEVANSLIKKHAADAQKDRTADEASVFDNQRKFDVESLRTALLLFSHQNVAGEQDYVFPPKDRYKIELVPDLISVVPKDPKSGQDYEYQVSETFDSFTLKAVLDNAKPGTTGYLCNQEECREY